MDVSDDLLLRGTRVAHPMGPWAWGLPAQEAARRTSRRDLEQVGPERWVLPPGLSGTLVEISAESGKLLDVQLRGVSLVLRHVSPALLRPTVLPGLEPHALVVHVTPGTQGVRCRLFDLEWK